MRYLGQVARTKNNYRILAGKLQWEKQTVNNIWEGNVMLNIR
jgi:hypothetical protein